MNDENRIEDLRFVTLVAATILMTVTTVLIPVAFDPIRHAILSFCIILLITVMLIFDGILKDRKKMIIHGVWYAIWVFNLITSHFLF